MNKSPPISLSRWLQDPQFWSNIRSTNRHFLFAYRKPHPQSRPLRCRQYLGTIGPAWIIIRPSWDHLKPSLGCHGPSWSGLGATLGQLAAILGPSSDVSGPSWDHIEPSWEDIGPSWGPVGASHLAGMWNIWASKSASAISPRGAQRKLHPISSLRNPIFRNQRVE